MLIGDLSEITGVTRKAIRYYEEIGLIPSPDRKYSEDYVSIIKQINQAQLVGFSLCELREVVAMKSENDHFPVKLACELIDNKQSELTSEIGRLKICV